MWKSIGWPLSSFCTQHYKKSGCNLVQLLLARSCCRESERWDRLGGQTSPCRTASCIQQLWMAQPLPGAQGRAPEATRAPALPGCPSAGTLLSYLSIGRHRWSSLAGPVEQFGASETRSARWNFLPAAQACFIHRFQFNGE